MVGDMGTVFKACKELQGRRKGKSDGSTYNVAKPQIERKTWKDHFAAVSTGRGLVQEATWAPPGPANPQTIVDGRSAGRKRNRTGHEGV